MFNLLLTFARSKASKFAGLILFLVLLFIVRMMVFPRTEKLWWILAAVIIAVIYISWYFWNERKSKQAANGIADAMVAGAKQDEASASPQKREAYRKARENLEYTMHLLEKSAPKDFKGQALYRLPWIMVVGPPSDGKTTAIKNAGITWPQDPRLDEAGGGSAGVGVEGTGGTRSCNWFFSTDSIILDTAGRWQARDQGAIDEKEWLDFLTMLQKFRPRRPINGLVALVSIERVLAGKESAKEWAQKVRRQINEIMEKLGTHLPVYIIFNKCDLIHGFVEFFQDLNKESRKQVWGFTRKYEPRIRKSGDGQESEQDAILADFDREFEELAEVLQRRRTHRLSDPQLFPSERSALCIFPGEFKALRENVREFVADVFYENPYGHNPSLRGVYFTSATQMEGNPILELMKKVAGQYDIPLDALPAPKHKSVDTYFLNDLMQDIIFKDQTLGGRFKKSLFDKSRMMLAGGLTLATLLVGAWMTTSYFVNKNKGDEVYRLADRMDNLSLRSEGTIPVVTVLDSLRFTLDDYGSSGFPFGVFYYLFGGNEWGGLTKAGRTKLAHKTDETFINDAWKTCERVLTGNTRANLARYISSYRTYLYLSNAPGADLVNTKIVAQYIMSSKRFRDIKDPVERSRYRGMLSKLLEYYSEYESKTKFEYDHKLIERAERTIRSKWRWSTLLKNILDDERYESVGFSTDEFNLLVGGHTIPYAYTATGWNEFAADAIDSTFDDITHDSIMVAILGNKMGSKDTNPLFKEYYKVCSKEWIAFFDALRLKTKGIQPENFFAEIADAQSPMYQLLIKAAEETVNEGELRKFFKDLHRFTGVSTGITLDDSLTTGSSGGAGTAPLDNYMNAMGKLSEILDEQQLASSDCAKEYLKAKKKIAKTKEKTDYNLSNSTLSSSLKRLLDRPFKYAKQVSSSYTKACINQSYKNRVYAYYEDEFKELYPFSRESNEEASPDELTSFLGRDGQILTFDSEEAQPVKQAGIKLSQQYETSIDLTKKLSKLLRNQNATVNLVLSQKMMPSSMQQLRISDETDTRIRYANGPTETVSLEVPWTSGELQLDLDLTSGEIITPIITEGPWAVIRLLDMANMEGKRGAIRFRRGLTVKFSLRGTSPLPWFREFKLPKVVCR